MFLCLFVLKQPLFRSLLLCSPSLSTSDFCFSSALFSQIRDPSAKRMTKMGARKTITTTITSKILSRQTKTMNHELLKSIDCGFANQGIQMFRELPLVLIPLTAACPCYHPCLLASILTSLPSYPCFFAATGRKIPSFSFPRYYL